MDFVVLDSMSPVSPTLVPTLSSLIRYCSPSKLPMGKSAAGVSVDKTTNSCGIVPAFVTENVIAPAGTVVVEGVIDHCCSETATAFCPAADAPVVLCDGGALVASELDFEHAAMASMNEARIGASHLPAVISSSPFCS